MKNTEEDWVKNTEENQMNRMMENTSFDWVFAFTMFLGVGFPVFVWWLIIEGLIETISLLT